MEHKKMKQIIEDLRTINEKIKTITFDDLRDDKVMDELSVTSCLINDLFGLLKTKHRPMDIQFLYRKK